MGMSPFCAREVSADERAQADSEDQLAESQHDGQADEEDDEDDPQDDFHEEGSSRDLSLNSAQRAAYTACRRSVGAQSWCRSEPRQVARRRGDRR
jgi:hypothetical protein